jgi:hypothetical protein
MDENITAQAPAQVEPSTDGASANEAGGTTTPMVLISVAQRNSLIEYMAKQPYQDVANGIDFLRNAPVVNVTLTVDGEKGAEAGA